MFATLAGGYPRPDLPAETPADEIVRAVVAELESTGIEIVSDGGVRRDDPLGGLANRLQGFEIGETAPYLETGLTYRRPRAIHEPRWDGPIYVSEWQTAKAATELPVKQEVMGPYTLARLADPGAVSRERLTMALADALAHELRALVAAGVPMIQVNEDGIAGVVGDRNEQQLFKAAHRRLTNQVRDAHLTLAMRGADVSKVPAATLIDPPYRSFLIDVVTERRNWGLIHGLPAERGVIVGIADATTDEPDDPEQLRWAALSVASFWRRGAERVGLAPSGTLAGRDRDAARRKLEALADAAIAAHDEQEENPELLDPRHLGDLGVERGWLATPPEPEAAAAT
jgi:methionine synthase II (cobalamin-independent)